MYSWSEFIQGGGPIRHLECLELSGKAQESTDLLLGPVLARRQRYRQLPTTSRPKPVASNEASMDSSDIFPRLNPEFALNVADHAA